MDRAAARKAFGNVNGNNVNGAKSRYMEPGQGFAKITNMKIIETRNKGDALILDCEVVEYTGGVKIDADGEVLGRYPDDNFKPGEAFAQYIGLGDDYTEAKISEVVLAVEQAKAADPHTVNKDAIDVDKALDMVFDGGYEDVEIGFTCVAKPKTRSRGVAHWFNWDGTKRRDGAAPPKPAPKVDLDELRKQAAAKAPYLAAMVGQMDEAALRAVLTQ